MSERATPETDNDTQFELAAWELLKEAREELEEHKASAERARKTLCQTILKISGERDQARELARELRDALKAAFDELYKSPIPAPLLIQIGEAYRKAKEVLP